jgi:ABC-type bacteriocin/lantibiotic exporter with double-glycine peptidase domain
MKYATARLLDRAAGRFLSGCAVLCLAAIAVAAASAGTWLDVPFVAQPEEGCGAASAAMVMQYWDNDLHRVHLSASNVETIQRELYSKRAKGILASALEKYLRESGYRTFVVRGEWQDLQRNIEKGRPLIVALAPSGPRHPLHYVVVAGIDADGEAVFVNDPAQRKLMRIGRSDFEKEWNEAGDWTLLALPN